MQQPDPEQPPESFAQQRLAICRNCENYVAMICKKCGCFMPAKSRLKSAECPIQLWRAVNF